MIALIVEIQLNRKKMNIHLNEDEIQQALLEFLSNQNIPLQGKKVEISLTAGRGLNGHSADIIIVNAPKPIKTEVTNDSLKVEEIGTSIDSSQQAIDFGFEESSH